MSKMTEENVLELLSKSEKSVYEYIKQKAETNSARSVKESMKEIGNQLELSEATVHRAIKKLRKNGIISIVPSVEKAESNEIVYYGVPDAEKQVGDIFSMIGELSASASRFEAILASKDLEIEKLQRENALLYADIDQVNKEVRELRAAQVGIDSSKIISSQPLPDGTTAYIVKD